MRRRVTLKLTSLKSALSFRAWIAGIPEKTRRIAAFSALFVLSALITLLVLVSGGTRVEAELEEENTPVSSVEQVIDDFAKTATQARQSAGADVGVEDALGVLENVETGYYHDYRRRDGIVP